MGLWDLSWGRQQTALLALTSLWKKRCISITMSQHFLCDFNLSKCFRLALSRAKPPRLGSGGFLCPHPEPYCTTIHQSKIKLTSLHDKRALLFYVSDLTLHWIELRKMFKKKSSNDTFGTKRSRMNSHRCLLLLMFRNSFAFNAPLANVFDAWQAAHGNIFTAQLLLIPLQKKTKKGTDNKLVSMLKMRSFVLIE